MLETSLWILCTSGWSGSSSWYAVTLGLRRLSSTWRLENGILSGSAGFLTSAFSGLFSSRNMSSSSASFQHLRSTWTCDRDYFSCILPTSVSIQTCFIPGSEEMEDDPIEDVDRNLTSCLDLPSVRWWWVWRLSLSAETVQNEMLHPGILMGCLNYL